MTADPTVGFWLRYVEAAGGLAEERGDTAVAVLPPRLGDLGLGDTVEVTADPEVAREDGAQLLGPGHPALDRAADDVLAAGDAGCAHLPWPTSSSPPSERLQERAHEHVVVDRGRLEIAPPFSARYAPLLRVGALATYTVSLEHRIQERLEVWVDARTGCVLDDRAHNVVETLPWLNGADARSPRLPADLERATAGGHAALERHANERLAAHARAGEHARDDERARAEQYFTATLESLARRRETAPAERVAALDGQAEATRAERTRRLQEIDEAYQPSLDLRPFRLHLVWAPALQVPARVRRGPNICEIPLVWLLAPVAAFVPVTCPACGATESLVAARDRLGCRACAV